jgi:hypothetical protein
MPLSPGRTATVHSKVAWTAPEIVPRQAGGESGSGAAQRSAAAAARRTWLIRK